MNDRFNAGEVLMAELVFTTGGGTKRRPVVVLRDAGDDGLLVAPVTSQAARVRYDTVIVAWQRAGLRLPSIIRAEKLATVSKAAVTTRLGELDASDWRALKKVLGEIIDDILHS